MVAMASSPTNALPPRSVRTCTECKQSKLRCDSKKKFPSPCSRCEARHLFCTVDASFKRTPARKRFEAMSKELQELRSRKDGQHQSSVADETVGSSLWGDRPTGEDTDDLELRTPIVSLEAVYVESASVTEIFKIFAHQFRPQLPIIGTLSTTRIYHTHPFLFWTIIIVVISHSARGDHAELFRQLREPYTNYLQKQTLEAPLPLHKVQALAFIIEWPLGVEMQTADPSWLYCGIAIQAARFMSLDRQQSVPSLTSLGVAAGGIQARINTWLGCFYVATSLAMHLGLPSPIDSDLDFAAIQDFLRQNTLSPVFATRVKVQLIVARFTTLLSRDIGDAASSSLIRLLDSELDALKLDGSGDSEDLKTVELCAPDAKMHFYALFITKAPTGSTSRQVMLRTALSAALRIIHISTSGWRHHPEKRADLSFIQSQRCLPKNHFRSFALSTIFLLRFFHGSETASVEEKQWAANHISLAGEHFKACSIEPGDEYDRTAKFFEVLARMNPSEVESKKMRLTHRMGVSIVLDAVTNAMEIRGRQVDISEDQTSDQPGPEDRIYQATYDPYSSNPANSNVDVLRGLWNDPVLSMLNFEPMSPTAGF